MREKSEAAAHRATHTLWRPRALVVGGRVFALLPEWKFSGTTDRRSDAHTHRNNERIEQDLFCIITPFLFYVPLPIVHSHITFSPLFAAVVI